MCGSGRYPEELNDSEGRLCEDCRADEGQRARRYVHLGVRFGVCLCVREREGGRERERERERESVYVCVCVHVCVCVCVCV